MLQGIPAKDLFIATAHCDRTGGEKLKSSVPLAPIAAPVVGTAGTVRAACATRGMRPLAPLALQLGNKNEWNR